MDSGAISPTIERSFKRGALDTVASAITLPAGRSFVSIEHFDVLIVGAGLSGVGAGCHLQREAPGKTYTILEGRDAIGGTWDLFRYPGIRSDSDMYTLGYAFRPWIADKAIADGTDIREYVRQTAADYGVDRHIRFGHKVRRASWSSQDAKWTVEAERGENREIVRFTCSFLYACAGYYSYEQGYTPDFAGVGDFKGTLIHPQKWPENLDYSGKRVVVIGSGATAVTIVPAMTDKAAHVTMLQRSPTYVVSLPARDRIAHALRKVLPVSWAYAITRWKNVLRAMLFYWLARAHPQFMKGLVRAGLKKELGPEFPINPHFKPRYNPWDQRLCLVPDADLFRALKSGKASIVTDEIETFTPTGVKLKSGKSLDADIVVTATGLQLLAQGGISATVDGRVVELPKTLSYKGMMLSDVPNFAYAVGYTNASWTLKVDLVSSYVCRLLNYMDRHGYRQCTPRRSDPSVTEEPLIDFNSGYVLRSIDQFPKQGSKVPWKLHQNYIRDLLGLRFGAVDDSNMEFAGPGAAPAGSEQVAGYK